MALAAKKIKAQKENSNWRSGRPEKATADIIEKVLMLKQQGLSTRKISESLDKAISHAKVGKILTSQVEIKPHFGANPNQQKITNI